MAAPTDVRVESNSTTSATLRWAYTGPGFISVWRAPNGGVFAEVSDPSSRVPPGTLEFVDSTAEVGAFYDYKLSDDAGATFSSVVSVVILRCEPDWGSNQFTQTIALPRPHSDEDITAHYLQNILAQIEAQTNVQVKQDPCDICSEEGAILFDCTNGCFNFRVIIDEEINSITVVGCEDGIIEWICPPNQECKVCGWPSGFGFGGDECKYNPIFGGANGRTVVTSTAGARMSSSGSRKGYNPRGGGGGGGGAGVDCPCKPDPENKLRIQCCEVEGECSLKCSDTTSTGKRLKMKICGGEGPYNVTKTGSVKLTLNPDAPEPVLGEALDVKDEGTIIYIVPPVNNGEAVAGEAYRKYFKYPCGSAGSCIDCFAATGIGCDDQLEGSQFVNSGSCDPIQTCNGTNLSSCNQLACKACPTPGSGGQCSPYTGTGGGFGSGCPRPCKNPTHPMDCDVCSNNFSVSWLSADPGGSFVCDKRTAGMITAGCNPCGLQSGSTVSIADATGTIATVVLTA